MADYILKLLKFGSNALRKLLWKDLADSQRNMSLHKANFLKDLGAPMLINIQPTKEKDSIYTIA